jgi:putative ABC transport system substrate-binding protein
MKRRDFLAVVGGATAGWALEARAQQSGSIRRIDLLMLYPEKDPQGELRARVFRGELEKSGWKVGGNLVVNFHWGTGDAEWVRSAVAQILQQTPDVMLANGDAAVRAAQQLTRTVPVIFIASGDPVGDGLVASLAHPGGNLTGFAVMEPTLGAKLLGMLKQVAPPVSRVGVLVNPDSATHQRIFSLLVGAAPSFAVDVVKAPARERGEIETAITK